tara:strand:- start:1610 stop:2338 length:729 start_codon:yes stop_codon:yes gene_type:complete
MPINIILFIFIFLLSTNSMANQSYKVVVGLSKPPYVIEESQTGFELELIQQLLTMIGKEPEFIFIPYGRSEKMLALPDIDAVLTVNEDIFPNSQYLSKSYISYENVAISMKKNAISLNNVAELADYSIAAFQLAHKALGAEFSKAVTNSSIYIQVANQEKQVELLLLGRVDIVVMDTKIFLHFLNKLSKTVKKSDIQIHHIFPLSPYQVAFKNSEDVEVFNSALKTFKASNKYQKIVEKYNF